MSDLIEDMWVLKPAFALKQFWYVVFIELYEENPASQMYMVGKWEIISRAFSVIDIAPKCDKCSF